MSKDKFISETHEKLQDYVKLSARLADITLINRSSWVKIKILALAKIQELKNKKEIISFLNIYINDLFEQNESNEFNFEDQSEGQKDFLFLAFFLEEVIFKYGEDFVLVDLLGQAPLNLKPSVAAFFERVINAILSFFKIEKSTQKSIPKNDDLFHKHFKQILSSVEHKEDIINKDILLKNDFFTRMLIYEMAKHLNPDSLVGIKPEDGQVTTKNQTDTNSEESKGSDNEPRDRVSNNRSLDSGSDSGFDSGSDSDSDSDSGFDSDFDVARLSSVNSVESEGSDNGSRDRVSNNRSLDSACGSISDSVRPSHLNSLENNDSGFSEESKPRKKIRRSKKERSEAAERFYARQKSYELHLKLEEKLKKKLQRKLKYCQERRNVYEELYKKYEIDKDSTHFSNEELKDYNFKFSLNKELYDFYDDYIEKHFSSYDKIKSSEKIKLYYKFKYSINQYKLDRYKSYIDDIENDVELGKKVSVYTLKTLGYYKEKCAKIYSPRVKKYELLIEGTESEPKSKERLKEKNTVHIPAKSKLPVEDSAEEAFVKKNQRKQDSAQWQDIDTSGIGSSAPSADENETTAVTRQSTVLSEGEMRMPPPPLMGLLPEGDMSSEDDKMSLPEWPETETAKIPSAQSTSPLSAGGPVARDGREDRCEETRNSDFKNKLTKSEQSVPQTEQDKSAEEGRDAVNTGKNPLPPPSTPPAPPPAPSNTLASQAQSDRGPKSLDARKNLLESIRQFSQKKLKKTASAGAADGSANETPPVSSVPQTTEDTSSTATAEDINPIQSAAKNQMPNFFKPKDQTSQEDNTMDGVMRKISEMIPPPPSPLNSALTKRRNGIARGGQEKGQKSDKSDWSSDEDDWSNDASVSNSSSNVK